MENFVLNSRHIKNFIGVFLIPIGIAVLTFIVALNTKHFLLLAWSAVVFAIMSIGLTIWIVLYNYKINTYQSKNIIDFIVFANNKIKIFLILLTTHYILQLLAIVLCCFPLYHLKSQLVVILSFVIFFKLTEIFNFIKWFTSLHSNFSQKEQASELVAIRITREDAPALWNKLESIAEVLKVTIPDNLLVGVDQGVWVTHQANFTLKESNLAITGSVLYFSVISLATHSMEEIAIICAHELGHLKIIDEAQDKGVNPNLLSAYEELIYWQANRESLLNYYFRPVTALCRQFSFFLDKLYSYTEIEADSYSLRTSDKVKVAAILIYHLSYELLYFDLMKDYFAGKIANNERLLNKIYQRFNVVACKNALNTFIQHPQFHEKTAKKRINILTNKQAILELPTPVICYANSCIKYINPQQVLAVESLFISHVKNQQQESIEDLREMSNLTLPTKNKTFRYSGGIVGFLIMLFAVIPFFLLDQESPTAAFSVILIMLFLSVGGFFIFKSMQSYLTITPQGLVIPLIDGETYIAWQEIDSLDFDENTMTLILSKWVVKNPQQLKVNWHLSEDGYKLSFISSSLTKKQMKLVYNYYASIRARDELVCLQKNGWLD